MRILIITPMLKEYHCAREVFSAVETDTDSVYRFARIIKKRFQLDILQCGFELETALTYYDKQYGVADIIIDSGSCASLSNEYDIGEIIRISRVCRDGKRDVYFDDPGENDQIRTASLIEVSTGIENRHMRVELGKKADVCSMESYSLCRFAELRMVRHFSWRVITDNADAEMRTDFKENLRIGCRKLYQYIDNILNDLSH
ncbi:MULTISPECIES: hypothetical protein [unclassified Oceanispirochaeta]|uniref:hypothetical protein n=1 Tax=unclassified Oceanispirochaeta TaxID=2635722 RepID=UPI000E08D33B|nr:MULTISPECIES: hypothetical protein [unclassified Oceanispirochaeta]MBF9016119.1 hypothetical protein [Oceanispirochaeta sp. M2]NPD72581.1 hypothetical protein [Oceanispirochaeta sp. M1]RDG31733.1 hypothetical protein DV872_10775 [Oceanispirochaeta sp. M1]